MLVVFNFLNAITQWTILSVNSVFYRKLLECWLEFRNLFLANKERLCIIWNNKDIRIDGKPVFYKSYYDSGICIIKDLLFNLDKGLLWDLKSPKVAQSRLKSPKIALSRLKSPLVSLSH